MANFFFKKPTKKEEKASRTGTLIAFGLAGRPVWTPRHYGALTREGYMKNPIIYRAVRMVAEAAASVPWICFEGTRESDAHPLLQLLARPNARDVKGSFLETVYGHLLTSGNAYLEAVVLDGVLQELHVLRPDRMKIIVGSDGWPQGYSYTVGGRSLEFSAEGDPVAPILHLTLFHPLNDHYGFAPIEAAQLSVDIHNAASSWNKALLDNAACPSGALIYGPQGSQTLSQEQFDRLKNELTDSYQGASNAGRPLLLEGGLDWKPMGLTPRDMDFVEAKNQAAREIALTFGVPPMLLGIPGDNTYSNYKEATLALWRQTILPLVARTADAFGAWLAPAFGGDLRVGQDLDAVEALSGERCSLWSRIQEADFLTREEKRMAVGYAPLPECSSSTEQGR